MRVLHWNMHHNGVPVDAKYANLPFNLKGITDALIKLKPDVVTLNEVEMFTTYGGVGNNNLQQMCDALKAADGRDWQYHFCGLTGSIKEKGVGVAILTCSPAFVTTHANLGGRPLLIIDQGDLYIGVVHMDPDSQIARVKQITRMLITLAQFDYPRMIIAGDFNAKINTPEMAAIPDYLTDAYTTVGKTGAITGLINTHKASRIDFQFYKGVTPVSLDVPDLRYIDPKHGELAYPSDHNPVLVVYKD